jgi:hypothetical protein
MKGLKGLALILALALVALSLLSRFVQTRSVPADDAVNQEPVTTAPAVAKPDADVPDKMDFAVKQEIREQFTLQPNVMVYVSGINGKLDVETSATDKAEVYLVRSVRKAEDFEERKVSVRMDNDGDLGITIHVNGNRSFWAFLGSRNDERQRLLLKLPRNVQFKASRIIADTNIGELDNALIVHGLNGKLKAARVTTTAELEGINGNLEVTFANLTKGIYTNGINGNLDLRFADTVNADVQFRGHHGQFNSELPNTTIKEQKHSRVEARIGNGGVSIEGGGINGNINLLAAAKVASK